MSHEDAKHIGRPFRGADKRRRRNVYLSDAEWAEVCAKAKAAGMKPLPYMRDRVLR